jgi:uncharacterized protein (DUF1684 family)
MMFIKYFLLAWLIWILGIPLINVILKMSGSLNKKKVSTVPHRAVIIWALMSLGIVSSSFLFNSCAEEEKSAYELEIEKHRKDINQEFADTTTSPLSKDGLAHFEGLDFFPPDEKYLVEAQFILNPDPEPFGMETTTERRPIYVKFGEAHFVIDGQAHMLEVYQSDKAKKIQEFKEYLFLPFKDLTNGTETYGGGRYIDLKIPQGNKIWIDFNKAYNPYCAYNHKYSCPVPPKINHLNIAIPAGVKSYNH